MCKLSDLGSCLRQPIMKDSSRVFNVNEDLSITG